MALSALEQRLALMGIGGLGSIGTTPQKTRLQQAAEDLKATAQAPTGNKWQGLNYMLSQGLQGAYQGEDARQQAAAAAALMQPAGGQDAIAPLAAGGNEYAQQVQMQTALQERLARMEAAKKAQEMALQEQIDQRNVARDIAKYQAQKAIDRQNMAPTTLNLGNKLVLADPATGQVLQEFPVGAAPTAPKTETVDVGNEVRRYKDGALVEVLPKGIAPGTTAKTGGMDPLAYAEESAYRRELGKNRGETQGNAEAALPDFELNFKALTDSVDSLIGNPEKGIKGDTRLSSWQGAVTGPMAAYFAGSDAAAMKAKIDTIKANIFATMAPTMKGLGALTEPEGKKLETAIANLSDPKLPLKDFQDEARKIIDFFKGKQAILREKARTKSRVAGGETAPPNAERAADLARLAELEAMGGQ